MKHQRPSVKFQHKKSLGQHFLHDKQLAAKIVALLDIQKGDKVFEIGPGQGALTSHLYDQDIDFLYIIEKDVDLVGYHKELAEKSSIQVKVVHGDAVYFPWEELCGRWKVVSNLPYNVASPIIWELVSRSSEWCKAVFMVQKEVGERICACAGSRMYGALSVWVQSFAYVSKCFVVKPGSFIPQPKVDSLVIALEPKNTILYPNSPKALNKIIKICFQQRRKQLQTIFKNAGYTNVNERLESIGISRNARPEDVSICHFHKMASEFFPHKVLTSYKKND